MALRRLDEGERFVKRRRQALNLRHLESVDAKSRVHVNHLLGEQELVERADGRLGDRSTRPSTGTYLARPDARGTGRARPCRAPKSPGKRGRSGTTAVAAAMSARRSARGSPSVSGKRTS